MRFPHGNSPARRAESALLLLGFFAGSLLSQSRNAASLPHNEFLKKLSAAAIERTTHAVRYDPAYIRIPYPGGDVPADTGVCTDEIIRSY